MGCLEVPKVFFEFSVLQYLRYTKLDHQTLCVPPIISIYLWVVNTKMCMDLFKGVEILRIQTPRFFNTLEFIKIVIHSNLLRLNTTDFDDNSIKVSSGAEYVKMSLQFVYDLMSPI